ncbi:MAG: class I SAM-dependent methyltransferase [Myxococcales bacterium]|nr:class I SAM-dependent methyltransferase [Myxococcales bacterium]
MTNADRYSQIYGSEAQAYDHLVTHEDYQGNLWRALEGLAEWKGSTVVEFGAGTGRLTRLFADRAAHVVACDASPEMLRVARQHLRRELYPHVEFTVAEHRDVPVYASADIAIAGWALGHYIHFSAGNWRECADQAVERMLSSVRAGGVVMIIETLGTGRREPEAPSAELAELYQRFESLHGFQRLEIRTDYRFASHADAVDSVRFFFGETLAESVRAAESAVVPECTGIWHRRRAGHRA